MPASCGCTDEDGPQDRGSILCCLNPGVKGFLAAGGEGSAWAGQVEVSLRINGQGASFSTNLGDSGGGVFAVELFGELKKLRDSDPRGSEVPFVATNHGGGPTVAVWCSWWTAAARCWVG